MLPVALGLVALERREDVRSRLVSLLAFALEAAHLSTSAAPKRPGIFSKPRRIRPFTVPIGRSEHRGDLSMREAAEIGEIDDSGLLRRELLQSVANLARLLATDRLRVGALWRLQAFAQPLVAHVLAGAHPIAAQCVLTARGAEAMPSTQLRTLPRERS